MVTPLVHQWDRHPWMRQSQAPLATWEGTCSPHTTPELPCWQWQDDAAPQFNQGCTPGLGQAAEPCAPLLTALPMSTFVPRTYNLHAAAQSKHITMLGRDGCVLPCSQGNGLITATASPPSHSSWVAPPTPITHLGGTKAFKTLGRCWSYSQSSQTELAPSCEERKAPSCPESSLVRAQVPNAISKKKNEVIAP